MSDSSSNPELPNAFIEAMSEGLAELSEQETPTHPQTSNEPFISFRNVNIAFEGRSVLEDVSFHVERGQTLCILGRSGVGKSVSLRLLMGFLQADSGSIQFDNQEIVGLD